MYVVGLIANTDAPLPRQRSTGTVFVTASGARVTGRHFTSASFVLL